MWSSTWNAAVLADPAQPGQSALEDAVHVSAETSRRLACDATRVTMHHAREGVLCPSTEQPKNEAPERSP
jgi:hypothetical protein